MASLSRAFIGMMHPHCLHCFVFEMNSGHEAHNERRVDKAASSTLGLFTMSHGRVVPSFFLYSLHADKVLTVPF